MNDLMTANPLYRNRPKATGITVRKLDFNPEKISRYYFARSPLMSHFLTALSSTFPVGEQFFVHSVRNVRDQITDPVLQTQIAAFIGQEAMHSKAHTEFNQAWRKDDYQLDNFQAWLERQNKHVRNLPPKVQLAITSAFEHFTALLGGYILKHPEVLSTLDEDAMKLYSTGRLFMQDKWKSLPQIKGNLFGAYLLVKMLVQLFPEYLSYYKKDFHPEQNDYSIELEYWKKHLAQDYQMTDFQY